MEGLASFLKNYMSIKKLSSDYFKRKILISLVFFVTELTGDIVSVTPTKASNGNNPG